MKSSLRATSALALAGIALALSSPRPHWPSRRTPAAMKNSAPAKSSSPRKSARRACNRAGRGFGRSAAKIWPMQGGLNHGKRAQTWSRRSTSRNRARRSTSRSSCAASALRLSRSPASLRFPPWLTAWSMPARARPSATSSMLRRSKCCAARRARCSARTPRAGVINIITQMPKQRIWRHGRSELFRPQRIPPAGLAQLAAAEICARRLTGFYGEYDGNILQHRDQRNSGSTATSTGGCAADCRRSFAERRR